jgi:hypothetical protein
MKDNRLFSVSLAMAAMLAAPAYAQLGRGVGLGGVPGGITGAATGSAAGSVAGVGAGSVNGAASAASTARAQGAAGALAGASAASIADNATLSSRAQTLLPDGEAVSHAAAGFGTQEQFLTAVHAAHDMNIPFDQLKAQMTGRGHVSLDKAILKVRPDLDAKDVKENVKLAGQQSTRDFVEASSGGKRDRLVESIASNSELSARLTPMLPQGMAMAEAAAGFKNQGQFIAALRASKNAGVPFADLKDRVTAGQSLGAAIHAMKPDMSSEQAEATAKTAGQQSMDLQAGRATAGANASVNASASADARAR